VFFKEIFEPSKTLRAFWTGSSGGGGVVELKLGQVNQRKIFHSFTWIVEAHVGECGEVESLEFTEDSKVFLTRWIILLKMVYVA
jgi:hypothetical protein